MNCKAIHNQMALSCLLHGPRNDISFRSGGGANTTSPESDGSIAANTLFKRLPRDNQLVWEKIGLSPYTCHLAPSLPSVRLGGPSVVSGQLSFTPDESQVFVHDKIGKTVTAWDTRVRTKTFDSIERKSEPIALLTPGRTPSIISGTQFASHRFLSV